ncbi:MAG: hypothetical protein PHQ03_05245 [Methylococcales bacterium]|nr:hypothetical protein [Methylococcales bacterium]
MTNWEILSLFENLNVRIVGGKPVLYKPVLILYALEQCRVKNERLMNFDRIERSLNNIFDECFPNEEHKNFHYAFGRLERDGIWEISDNKNLRRTHSGDVYKSDLLKNNIAGGFTKDVFEGLTSDYFLIREIGDMMLYKYIDDSVHEHILNKIKYK